MLCFEDVQQLTRGTSVVVVRKCVPSGAVQRYQVFRKYDCGLRLIGERVSVESVHSFVVRAVAVRSS